MRLTVGRTQTFDADVRIELRGRQRRVAEKFLDHTKIGAAFEEVGRGGMSETVWAHRRPARGLDGSVHDAAGHALIEASTARAEEQRFS